MSDTEDGLLAITLSDSDDQPAAAEPDAKPRESRTGQSSQAFDAVKRSYATKLEEGEVRCPAPRGRRAERSGLKTRHGRRV